MTARPLLFLAVALLAACGRAPVDPALVADVRTVYDEASIEYDPLCVYAGPFPIRGGWTCPKCEAMRSAGLVERSGDEEPYEYRLTADGRRLYRDDPDPAYVDVVRARFARQAGNAGGNGTGKPDHVVDAVALKRPRVCLGRTRFHAADAALQPLQLGANTYRSVRVVAKLDDTSGLLFDPRLAPLELRLPPKPEPGTPILLTHVVTLDYVHGDPLPTLSDVRYGPWVDEE